MLRYVDMDPAAMTQLGPPLLRAWLKQPATRHDLATVGRSATLSLVTTALNSAFLVIALVDELSITETSAWVVTFGLLLLGNL